MSGNCISPFNPISFFPELCIDGTSLVYPLMPEEGKGSFY